MRERPNNYLSGFRSLFRWLTLMEADTCTFLAPSRARSDLDAIGGDFRRVGRDIGSASERLLDTLPPDEQKRIGRTTELRTMPSHSAEHLGGARACSRSLYELVSEYGWSRRSNP